MDEIEYPNIFKKADVKSGSYQKYFININIVVLACLIIAAIISSLQLDEKWPDVVASIFLFLSLFLTVILLIIKPERKWYDGRAIAESVKSLTWKFITATKPFSYKYDLQRSEEKFIKNLKQIIGQKKEFFKIIGEEPSEGEQIPQSMIELRKKSLQDKIKFYVTKRLEEQRKWYYNKSKKNRKNKNIFFGFILFFQVIAIITLFSDFNLNIDYTTTPVIVCIASALIAWLQLKRFQELTESYGITATELSLIKSKAKHIKDEPDFENFVDDAETAISREHTLWLARRDSMDLFN